jgi:hypothetical protein
VTPVYPAPFRSLSSRRFLLSSVGVCWFTSPVPPTNSMLCALLLQFLCTLSPSYCHACPLAFIIRHLLCNMLSFFSLVLSRPSLAGFFLQPACSLSHPACVCQHKMSNQTFLTANGLVFCLCFASLFVFSGTGRHDARCAFLKLFLFIFEPILISHYSRKLAACSAGAVLWYFVSSLLQ